MKSSLDQTGTLKNVSLATFRLQINLTSLLRIPRAEKVQNEFVYERCMHERVQTEQSWKSAQPQRSKGNLIGTAVGSWG